MTPRTKSPSSSPPDPRLHALSALLCLRIDDLLERLRVGLARAGKMLQGCCPVHGGDNPQALTLYPTGDTAPGYWRCYTRHCHQVFRPTILGFVRGVLSGQRGWSDRKPDRAVPFRDAVGWCCSFLGVRLEDLKVDGAEVEKARFAGAVASFTRRPSGGGVGLDRASVRGRLAVPAPYFVARGWSPEILDRYDVGQCSDPSRAFHDRAVVPVYDDSGRWAAGYTARSVHPQCASCRLWHAPAARCPDTPEGQRAACKWSNSPGFERESHLYNWWFARKPVEETGVACLVEGAGEVWRLAEAGVEVGLGLFGNLLTDEQQVRLEMSGAMTLICLLNNDDAGRVGSAELRDKLSRCYRLVFPELPANDLGEMTPAAVRGLVQPLIEKYRKRF